MKVRWILENFDLVQYLLIGAGLIFAVCALITLHRIMRMMPCHRHLRALPELLCWARDAGQGVITLKNGGMMSLYDVAGCDLENLDEDALRQFRRRLSQALQRLDGSWALHFSLLRGESPVLEGGDYRGSETGAALNLSHIRAINAAHCHQNRRLMALIRKPSRARHLMGPTADEVGDFIRERDALAEEFSSSLGLALLCGGEGRFNRALSFLKTVLAGMPHEVAEPDDPQALDSLLAPDDFHAGCMPAMGSRHIACVAVDAYPSGSLPDMLGALEALPFPLHFSTRFICYDSLRSQAALKRRRRFFEQRRRGFFSQVMNVSNTSTDQDAEAQISDLDRARASLSAQDEIFGALTQVVVLTSEDPEDLRKRAAATVKAIEDIGFTARVETVNAVEAFLSSLPGDLKSNLRRPLMSQKVLSDLLPVNSVWEGESQTPCPLYREKSPLMVARTPEGGHFYLNLHSSDLGNTLIFGPPGSGKSVLLNALCMNLMRYGNMRVWVFERGFSLKRLCQKLGGEHVTLDNSCAFAPLAFLTTPEDRARAAAFVTMLCADSGVILTPEDRECLASALELMAAYANGTHTLSDLCVLLSSSQNLTRALRPHLKGLGGGLLDGDRDQGFDRSLTVFECAGLLERQRDSRLLLRHLLGRLRRECEATSDPKAIILDEAWLMFRDGAFRDELITWLKTLRKHNTAVILATQSLADPAATGHTEALFDCAPTRIYLPNSGATEAFMQKHYAAAGLTPRQIERIAGAVPKRDYFMQKPGHFSEFQLSLSPSELEIFTVSGARALLEDA